MKTAPLHRQLTPTRLTRNSFPKSYGCTWLTLHCIHHREPSLACIRDIRQSPSDVRDWRVLVFGFRLRRGAGRIDDACAATPGTPPLRCNWLHRHGNRGYVSQDTDKYTSVYLLERIRQKYWNCFKCDQWLLAAAESCFRFVFRLTPIFKYAGSVCALLPNDGF